MFKTNFSGHNKIWGAQKIWGGTASECPPLDYGSADRLLQNYRPSKRFQAAPSEYTTKMCNSSSVEKTNNL